MTYDWNDMWGSPIIESNGSMELHAIAGLDFTGSGSIYAGTTTSKYVQLHSHEPTLVFTYGATKVYGATQSLVNAKQIPIDLLIVCNDLARPGSLVSKSARDFVKVASEGLKADLEALSSEVEELSFDYMILDWVDYSVPPKSVKDNFWEVLTGIVTAHKHVVFCCAGGHGRTGTALAEILKQLTGINGFDAISLTRAMYCSECIENDAQKRYIMRDMDKIEDRLHKLPPRESLKAIKPPDISNGEPKGWKEVVFS